MRIRDVGRWTALLAGVALMACAGRDEASRTVLPRPNIVFVLLDDVRFDDLVDHPFVELPNLRRLSTEGTSFATPTAS